MVGLRRLYSLVLAVLFVLGTFGVSNLDAWLYHGRGADQGISQPHYEPAGSTCGHADRCALGITVPGPREPTPISVVGLAWVSRLAEILLAPAKPHDGARPTLPQPRGPPSLPV